MLVNQISIDVIYHELGLLKIRSKTKFISTRVGISSNDGNPSLVDTDIAHFNFDFLYLRNAVVTNRLNTIGIQAGFKTMIRITAFIKVSNNRDVISENIIGSTITLVG